MASARAPPSKTKIANYKFIFSATALQFAGSVNDCRPNTTTERFVANHARRGYTRISVGFMGNVS